MSNFKALYAGNIGVRKTHRLPYNKQKVRSRDDRHAAHSPSAREGLPVVIRGLPGGIREVCGSGSLGTRGATGGIRGKLTRHSGTQRIRGFREVFGSLGTRGGSEGSRRWLLFGPWGTGGKLGRHPGRS